MRNNGVNNLDALSKPIVFGKVYGYSQSNNGRMSVTTGEALKFTDSGKVTLDVLDVCSSYGGGERNLSRNNAKKVSVSPFLLFPCPSLDVSEKSDTIDEVPPELKHYM